MKYIVTTWETLESKYEVEAEGKDDAWKRVLDNEGEQVAKNWLDNWVLHCRTRNTSKSREE